MQSLGLLRSKCHRQAASWHLEQNVGQGIASYSEFDMPEENFDYESEAVDQGVQGL